MWHIRVVLKAKFSDNNRATAVSISLDSAEIWVFSWLMLCACRAPADKSSPVAVISGRTRFPYFMLKKLLDALRAHTTAITGLQLANGSMEKNKSRLTVTVKTSQIHLFHLLFIYWIVTSTLWLSFLNLALFGPHTFIPAGCSGCVQVGAGECSNEHEAKHFSPSEPDLKSYKVDWVHVYLLLNKNIWYMGVKSITSSHHSW